MDSRNSHQMAINRKFMLKNAENDANTECIESELKNNNEKLLMHQNFVPTLPGA
jgi:hypothetical protein